MERHVILKIKDVQARTGLSRSSIYALGKIGMFPKPIKIGKRAVGWLEQDIDNWMLDKIQASKHNLTCGECSV